MSEELKAAQARIACLEGEIAKRDARIAELEARYQRDVYGLNNEGDPIGGDPAGGYANDNARLRSELAAIKAQEPVRYWFIGDAGQEKGSRHCKKSSSCGSLAFFESELDAKNAAQRHHGTEVYAVNYYAAPSAPAADAGLIDMYRHLQTVTPYRFKKIQDASVTDGGDVLYFHKDRFDAALLDDMAANCAKESK